VHNADVNRAALFFWFLCRKTRVVDDGRAVVGALQVARRVQQPGIEVVQVHHGFGPRKYIFSSVTDPIEMLLSKPFSSSFVGGSKRDDLNLIDYRCVRRKIQCLQIMYIFL